MQAGQQNRAAAAVAAVATSPQWVAGVPLQLGQLVYNEGYLYRVQEAIANPQVAPTATNRYYLKQWYDDSNIYTLARAIRDRVDGLDRNVIRWNKEIRVPIPSGGGNPSYVSGDAFVVSASGTTGADNIFTLAADDYPRQGDYLSIRVRPDSVPIVLKGLRFGSATGPTTMTVAPGTLVNIHAASDSASDITADYWVVHGAPSTGAGTPVGTPRDPYDVPAAKRKQVVDAGLNLVTETDEAYFGKRFGDDVYGPDQPARYECLPFAPAQDGGTTVWKWARTEIL